MFGHGPHGNNPHHKNTDYCKYTNTKGERFDLHLLANHYAELQFFDTGKTGSTVYFHPCGTVSPMCGENATVCLLTSAAKEVTYGSSSVVLQSESHSSKPNSNSLELTFGGGEKCNNGLERKAIITYICNMELSDSEYTYPKVTGEVEDCMITLTVETPFACPVANYCASITDDNKCRSQQGACVWRYGRCHANTGCFGGLSSLSAGIISFTVVTVTGLLLVCLCGLCICACKKSSRKSTMKKTRACKGKKRSAKPKPEASFDSFSMPYQLVPGGLGAPVNPYSNIQGYPMVTLASDEHSNL